MNTNFMSMWGCVICSSIWQADGNFGAATMWIVMAGVYGICAIIGAFKS